MLVLGPMASTMSLADADARFEGENDGDGAGWSVARAGDLDGDGDADLVIGAPYVTGVVERAGAVSLLFGGE